MSPDLSAIVPESLRVRPQWVLWRYIERDGRTTKAPVNAANGGAASSTDAATWTTFDKALDAAARFESSAGVGFVFTHEDPFVGVDLDDCIVDGVIVRDAQAIIDALNSYTEISPSGKGVKIIAEAHKPDGAGCRKRIDGFKQIEVYDSKRFFTITGTHLGGTPHEIEQRQSEIEALCRRLWPAKAPSENPLRERTSLDLSDAELIDRATAARNGDAFKRLYAGDKSYHGDDHSAADLALCNLLAFWTGRDAARIDRIFRTSGLMRPKWERTDYRERTISAAIASCAEVYGRSDCVRTGAAASADRSLAQTARLRTDVGNAARLVLRHGDAIRYAHGPGRWLIWDGAHWRPDDRGEIVRRCKDTALAIFDEAKRADGDEQQKIAQWAMASQKRDRLSAMAALAEPETAVTPDELDADPWALNVTNGTLDLRTGQLHPHRQSDLITKIAPVEYDPDAPAPRFERFLDEVFDGDEALIAFVQRWHGFCLTADIREQLLVIYHGEGCNGKSVLLDTISAVMGDYAAEAPPDLLTVRKHPEHPTEIADLLGRRLVVASETERDSDLRLQLVKRLTGNARLKARRMRRDYFDFARTHKMVLVTNNRPVIGEDTEAVWRRIRLVPFNIVIAEARRDATLMRTLAGERPGIIAWMVRGCLAWQREGLAEPEAVVTATAEYRGGANSVDAFVADCCSLGDNMVVVTAELLDAFERWCAENRRLPLRARAFAAALRAHGCVPDKRDGRRVWTGLSLTEGGSGRDRRNGRDLPYEPLCAPHEGENGQLASNPVVPSGRVGRPTVTKPT